MIKVSSGSVSEPAYKTGERAKRYIRHAKATIVKATDSPSLFMVPPLPTSDEKQIRLSMNSHTIKASS
ncbi:MAG: hypothetical protein ACOX2W_02570 [Desulfomonilia bacterium]